MPNISSHHLFKHGHDFPLQPFDVVLDLPEQARGFIFIEVAIEGDFIPSTQR
jgi:hypothetical protein